MISTVLASVSCAIQFSDVVGSAFLCCVVKFCDGHLMIVSHEPSFLGVILEVFSPLPCNSEHILTLFLSATTSCLCVLGHLESIAP